MLGRAGIDAILVDPHEVYPPELRCEKFDQEQVALLQRTGIADLILPSTAKADDIWIARFGRLLDKKPAVQRGVMYERLVGAARAAIPENVQIVFAKAMALSTSGEEQRVTLSSGDEISARLVVLANGLNISLRHSLGLERKELSRSHSITIGFDIEPIGRGSFAFPALTYYPEHAADEAAFLTLFPVLGGMRANYCTYRQMNDPWLQKMRQAPRETLLALMPGLTRITGEFNVVGAVKIRPADLYVTTGHIQPGVVLVGDAFSTSCPAAGTGSGKVLTDVERLCNVYIPAWLATDGMSAEKIAAFYSDPVKVAYDGMSIARAFDLRSLSTDPALNWRVRRWARFFARLCIGQLRKIRTAVRHHPSAPPSVTDGAHGEKIPSL
jgi:2-polyprenyl-6-methoxyphenol hydroxylase-like FAD-dependent oxidoreductase